MKTTGLLIFTAAVAWYWYKHRSPASNSTPKPQYAWSTAADGRAICLDQAGQMVFNSYCQR